MVTPATIKARFPEFATVDDSKIQIFIDDAILILNETFWGTKYDLGVSYLAAHFLSLALSSEAGAASAIGAVSSRAVDGVSISYSTMTPENHGDAYYSSTMYGQRYLALRRTLPVAAFSV